LNLALIGMPGCGKSTVGKVLARHLDATFVDADTEIETRIGMPIRTYFEIQGEPAFRDVEQQVMADLTQRERQVIATGGGAVLRSANREALRARCKVFYLRATPEELFRRLRHDTHRPLLQVGDPLKRLRDLYRERDPLYRQTAHYTAEAPRPSVPGLLNMILMQLELSGILHPDKVPASVGASAMAGANTSAH
jgi:shikimate kinase